MIGSLVSGVVGAIGGAINSHKQQQTANKNFQLQQDAFNYQKEWNQKNFDYQKELNDTMMAREDNAVQRRAKDLEAAGLSKTLAAGSSASAGAMSSNAGSPISNVPQQEFVSSFENINRGVMNGLQSFDTVSRIDQTQAQSDLLRSEARLNGVKEQNTIQDTALKRIEEVIKTIDSKNLDAKQKAEIKKIATEALKNQVEADIRTLDYDYYRNTGIPETAIKNESQAHKLSRDLVTTTGNGISAVGGYVNRFAKWIGKQGSKLLNHYDDINKRNNPHRKGK